MPERLAGSCFHGFERFGIVTEEDQAARRGHGAGRRTAIARLGISPLERIGIKVIREQNFFTWATRDAFHTSRIVLVAFGEFLWLG